MHDIVVNLKNIGLIKRQNISNHGRVISITLI